MKSFILKRKQALLWLAMMLAMPAARAAIPPTDSPFASTPGNLVNTETTAQNNSVKPNVLLLFDDSISMYDCVPGVVAKPKVEYCVDRWGRRGSPFAVVKDQEQRAVIVLDALREIWQIYSESKPDLSKNPQRLTMNWNILAINGKFGNKEQKSNMFDALCKMNPALCAGKELSTPLFTDGFKKADEVLNKLTEPKLDYYNNYAFGDFGSDTPIVSHYVAGVKYLYDQLKYQCQKSYMVVLSDGIPEADQKILVEKAYGTWGKQLTALMPSSLAKVTDDFAGIGENQGISRYSKVLQATDLKTTGTDAEGSPWDGVQNIQTYAVGFSEGLGEEGKTFVRNAARSDDGKGAYLVITADEVVKAFQDIFQTIAESSVNVIGKTTVSTATPAATSASIEGLAANLSLDTNNWSSQLRFNRLDSSGKPMTDSKGANLYYPADYSSRRILVNNGNGRYWLDQTNASNYYADFGFAANQSKEFQNAFIPWLARSSSVTDAQIQSTAASLKTSGATLLVDKYRVRADSATDSARMMGDVLNTNVLAAGDYVVTGANDGMLYMFKKTSVSTTPYQLVLNYLPVGMPRESTAETLGKSLPTIARSDYGQAANPHIYGINGGLRYVKTPKTAGRAQQSVLLATMGEGGRGAFALRLAGCDSTHLAMEDCVKVGLDANNGSWLTSVPLWESDKSADNTLGYTISTPSIYPVSLRALSQDAQPESDVLLAGFVANGFRSNNHSLAYDETPTLYIYDMLGEDFSYAAPVSANGAGKLIKKMATSGTRGALASPAVVDLDHDGVADVVYAGDYNGDLYRFDLRGDVDDWYVAKIYDGSITQPITAQPTIYNLGDGRVIVLVGTGSDLFSNDRFNTDVQLYMGIYDDLSNHNPQAMTLSDMLEQKVTTQDKRRKLSNYQLEERHRGWYIRLAQGGTTTSTANGITTDIVSGSEKSVTQGAVLLKTVYFTTRIYRSVATTAGANTSTTPTCKAVVTSSDSSTGQSWLMGVNVLNGGMPSVSNSGSEFSDEEAAGTLYDNMLSGVVIYSNRLLKEDSSLTATKSSSKAIDDNGLVRSGEIPELDTSKTGTPVPSQDCVRQNDYRILISQSDPDQGLISQGLGVKQCGGRLIRVNFRELINN